MKTKKHYTSFHPTLGFFVPLQSVIDSLQQSLLSSTTSSSPSSPVLFDIAQYRKPNGPREQYEPLLKSGLTCCHCREEFANIPALKRHLESEWEAQRTKGVGRYGRAGKMSR
jgi:aprataxin